MYHSRLGFVSIVIGIMVLTVNNPFALFIEKLSSLIQNVISPMLSSMIRICVRTVWSNGITNNVTVVNYLIIIMSNFQPLY